jgi:L-threonylcarbamoyladenylate synthase
MIRFDTPDLRERERGLLAAATALRRGGLVGLPLDSTYGLAADAFNSAGTQALRDAKGRAGMSIPVMVPKIGTVAGIARVDADARRLMRDFWPGPLTLVLPAQPTLAWSLTDPAGRIAVRMPLHPVALELLDRTGPLGVVAAGHPPLPVEPIGAATVADSFPTGLAAHVAVLLDAGPLPAGRASAVIDLTGARPLLVRSGPLDVGELRACCPDLVVPTAGAPQPGT